MAYEIFWRIPFKSLRTGTVYTVNIYKDDDLPQGYPLTLTGSAQPFTTDEGDDDDLFAPIRTQTGYISIVDNGLAINSSNAEVAFDWKGLIPTTDTDRPVTLTHVENGTTVVDWQGYMQAQNFDSKLYGNPDERNYPIHCALEALSYVDVDPSAHNGVVTFASILDYALQQVSALTFTNIYIQGGADAAAWLQKKIDWMMFADIDETENTIDGNCTVQDALAQMCQYWGWTMRTKGQNIYMTCVDDTSLPNFLILTRAQLVDYPILGTGTIDTTGYVTQAIGNVFASTNNKDILVRGSNKASVKADCGEIDENIVLGFTDYTNKVMHDLGYVEVVEDSLAFTHDLTSFSSAIETGEVNDQTNDASFNIMRLAGPTYKPVVRMYGAKGTYHKAALTTSWLHVYNGGKLTLHGTPYHGGSKVEATIDGYNFGSKHIKMRIGIGTSIEDASWWNGHAWVDSEVECYVKIGGTDGIMYTTPSKEWSGTDYIHESIPVDNLYGYVFVHFMGADESIAESSLTTDVYDVDIADFSLTFERNEDPWRFIDSERRTTNEYKNKNNCMVHDEWSADVMYSSDNYCKFGAGVVLNPDNSYFIGWNYANHQLATTLAAKPSGYPTIDLATATQPEQHLANRVAKFWNHAHRKITCELRTNLIPALTPLNKVTIDGSTLYPYAVSREWRDDVTILTLIEI